MDRNTFFKRSVVIVVIIALATLVAGGRLFNLQIVNGKEYLEKSERRLSRSVTVKAPRGEILDRYGRPLVTNRSSFAIKIDAAAWKKADKSRVIWNLISICNQNKQPHIDSLPITPTEPFAYTYQVDKNEQEEKKILKYLKKKKWPQNSSAQDVVRLICEKYGLSDQYNAVQKRAIAGVYFEMEQRGFSSSTPYTFAQDVNVALVTKIKEQNRIFPGVLVDIEPIREYQTPYAAHILGRVGQIYKEEYDELKKKGYKMDDVVGKDGMEKTLETYLRGTDGTRAIETTSTGKITNVLSSKDPILGNNCVLALDIRLQEAAEKSLAAIVPRLREQGKTNSRWGGNNAKGAAAVAIDVRSGDVIACASYPTYSLENYNDNYATLLKDPLSPMFNRSISGVYPPGSTFKMVTSLAGLESGTITTKTEIQDKGIYMFYAPSYKPMCDIYKTYHKTHGYVNVTGALKVSCNYFYYEIGRLMGIDKIEEYAKLFGFGEKTGIDLFGERSGQVASENARKKAGKQWYAGETLGAAIGQSDTLVTPIQIANYIATLCNGGTRFKPHLLKTVKNPANNATVYDAKAQVLGNIKLQEKNINAVLEGMHQAAQTKGGTAAATFLNYPVSVGAKTGSAQAPGGSHAIFVAYAPVEDPEIAVAVVVENGGQGSRIASVARDIFDAYFFDGLGMEQRQSENMLLR